MTADVVIDVGGAAHDASTLVMTCVDAA